MIQNCRGRVFDRETATTAIAVAVFAAAVAVRRGRDLDRDPSSAKRFFFKLSIHPGKVSVHTFGHAKKLASLTGK